MQKSSVTTLIVVVAVAAAILGAEWYYFDYRPRLAEKGGYDGEPLPELSDLTGDGSETPGIFSTRSSEIIECHDPEVGTFYTNAASCEDADLEQNAKSPPPDLPAEN